MGNDPDLFIQMSDATLLGKLDQLLSYCDSLSQEDQLLLIEIKKRFSARINGREQPNRSARSIPLVD